MNPLQNRTLYVLPRISFRNIQSDWQAIMAHCTLAVLPVIHPQLPHLSLFLTPIPSVEANSRSWRSGGGGWGRVGSVLEYPLIAKRSVWSGAGPFKSALVLLQSSLAR